MKDDQILEAFIYHQFNTHGEGGFIKWLVPFIKKPKADQKTEYVTWVEDQKTRTQAMIDALDANKIAAEDKLTAELNKLTAEAV